MYRKSVLSLVLCLLSITTVLAFQDDQITLLSKLTGASPIAEDTTLTERYSQTARNTSAAYLQKHLAFFCDEATISAYSKTGKNVIGVIGATTDTDEWIVLGAHYDSVKDCPGANDNATGVSLVYAIAQHLAQLEERNYHVYIVFFDEEERGLIGSRAFAKRIKKEGVKLISAHTVDQMGWDDDGDRGIELEMPTDALKKFYLDIAKAYNYEFPIQVTDVTSTDHKAFREIGFNAIGITEEYKNHDSTPHYHKSTDTFETVNQEYLKSTTAYVKQVFEALVGQ
jgi:Zn-dependent M28 family amino/carboxypeptidase